MTELAPQQPQPPADKKQINVEDLEKLQQLAEAIGPLMRALDGLPIEDDPTLGFINRKDDKQTAIFDQEHADMVQAWIIAQAKLGGSGDWLRIMNTFTAAELPLSKTVDGKNYVFTAHMVGKGQPTQGPNSVINIGQPQWNNPNWNPTQGPPEQQQAQQGPPKKKHWWSR